jgi:hypothetical protein
MLILNLFKIAKSVMEELQILLVMLPDKETLAMIIAMEDFQ